MFQKHSIMSMKKKSKSLGHLTALNSHPGSPQIETKAKTNGHLNMIAREPPGGGRSRMDSVQPTAAKYMKRFLSPVSHEREYMRAPEYISSPIGSNNLENNKLDKQLQTSKKTTPKKLKGVMKNKGGGGGGGGGAIPNPVAMGRALIARNFTPQKSNSFGNRTSEGISDIFGGKENGIIPSKHRVFIMDTQVKYTIGVQMQERNLFLFNDLLLIAKERSSSHFKLKDQVPLCDVWMSTCIPDVSEVTLDSTTSFVVGWPITNAVLTFSSQAERDLWWSKLAQLTSLEREHSPAGASINITYFDNSTNFEHLKSIYVAITDTSRDCIEKALSSLPLADSRDTGQTEQSGENRMESGDLNGSVPRSRDPTEYQLWVKTKLDESPYPLIGHEIPLVIKLNWMRQSFNNKNQKTYDEYRQGCRCSFILRRVGQVSNFNEVGSQKKKLKKVKSSIRLQNVFRRVSQGAKGNDSVDGGAPAEEKKIGKLFGRRLEDICRVDGEVVILPPPVLCMLRQLEKTGPCTVGIFRRGPNVRTMRDLRDKLDCGDHVDWEEISVFVTAALLKDFLRSLPDCVLQCEQYTAWSTAFSSNSLDSIKRYLADLPAVNRFLLHNILFILHKTAENSQENMMTCSNLSICVGPSLLWSTDPSYMLQQSYTKEVSGLVQMLIENFSTLFSSCPNLLGEEPMDTAPPPSHVQGQSHVQPTVQHHDKPELKHNIKQKGGLFDHSSLDSLLDPPYPEDDLARQSGTEGVSLTNLSHDSGLTTSDSQLYAFEEAENNSFSSDDFCIETITSNENTVHAIVNKKFLSRYQNSYTEGGEYQEQENHSPARRKLNQRNQKHRDRMHRRIHRNSEYSNSFSIKSEPTESAAYNYEVRTMSVNYPLRRTASEESVQRTSNFEIVQVNNNNRRKRPVVHRKGRAPNPPKGSKTSPSIIRSNSVNQVRHWEQNNDWYRSKSTTRLHSEDSEDSCSTLSDEDSTPHVSRSNSYGRSEENSFANPDDSFNKNEEDTTYDIYLHEERNLNISTNLQDAFHNNAARKTNREFDSFSCETPPGYEESIYRQRLLKLQGRPSSRPNSYISSSPSRLPEKVVEKQVELSAKAKAVFEDSLRQYEVTKEAPPPIPPKTDRPPLPPKQRSRRSTEHESSDDQTYVNSLELRQNRNKTRLNITSPVSTPVQSNRQSSSEERESSEFVYGSYFSARGSTKVSVPVIHESEFPPALPQKEVKTPERSESNLKKRQVTSTKIVSTTKMMKSVETQTDESDFVILYPDERGDDDSFNHTDSEYSPESNRSISPDYMGPGHDYRETYLRSQDQSEFYLDSNPIFERPVSAQSVKMRQAGRRKLEPVQSVPVRSPADPVIAGEINWSVSQLRTLFNQGLQAQSSLDSNPDQYRSNRQSMIEPRRMNYHNISANYSNIYGTDNQSILYSTDNQHTDSDQESYV